MNKERILVIEDEALIARELKGRLTKMGWEVAGIAYGLDAIELARRTQPDLLLSDIHLKDGVDGIDVALQIQSEMDIPVVFLTAYSDTDTVERAKAAGPFGYVIKPVENRDLQITIEMALYKSRVERELRQTKQLLQTALTCIGNALIFVDATGTITNMNADARTRFDGDGRSWQATFGMESGSSMAEKIARAFHEQRVTRLAPFVVDREDRHAVLVDGIVGPLADGGVFILRELAEINDAIEVMPSTQEILSALGPDQISPSESSLCQMLLSPDAPNGDMGRILEEVARELDGSLRSTDVLSVLSGSLVSVSLPYTSIEEARSIAESLQKLLNEHVFPDGQHLSFSIGLAHSMAGDQQPLELFRRAADALDRARDSGANRIVIWTPAGDDLRATDLTSEREYQQLILVWNVMNAVARSGTVKPMARGFCSHLFRGMDLDAVVLVTRTSGEGITAQAGMMHSGEVDSVTELNLSADEFELMDRDFSEITNECHHGLTWFFPVNSHLALLLRARVELEASQVTFLRTLVGYFAVGVARVSIEPLVKPPPGMDVQRLVHGSSQMENVLESARLVAPTDATVLIVGESGTGKELLARHIHDTSPRQQAPFVIVDCGAVVDNLIESELFGHEKGAFTGADRQFSGRLREAQGGTVLLDEIGELPLPVQVKLLRFVQNREVMSVGSSSMDVVDTRVIAATNRDLRAMVSEGTFREDLYYRLNVFSIRSLPLRERPDDILVVAGHYLAQYAHQYGKGPLKFNAGAEKAMLEYDWPGNVRELMNIVNRSVILCKDRTVGEIHLGLFPSEKSRTVPGASRLSDSIGGLVDHALQDASHPPVGEWLEEDLIVEVMSRNGGVMSRAAEQLSIPETTLRRKVGRINEPSANRTGNWCIPRGVIDQLLAASAESGQPVLEMAQKELVQELQKRAISRQDAAGLLGVSLPTYRRYLTS